MLFAESMAKSAVVNVTPFRAACVNSRASIGRIRTMGGFGRETMGGGDMLAALDLATFRVLPWAHKCSWVLGDLYLKSGERCPFDPRLVMQTACARLAQQG
jgi:glutamine synthetase